jgi:hypothetical protein
MASKKDRLAKRISPKSVRIYFAAAPDDLIEQRIRMQAFEVYERRRDAGVAGDSVSDWLCAESELNRTAHSRNNDRSAPSRANA